MRQIIMMMFLAFLGKFSFAQKVEDKAYDFRLKVLLSHNVKEVTIQEAKKMEAEVIFLDAREKKEYEVSHIKNAKWVGYDDFEASRVKGISKKTKIIVYCSVGYRSEKVTKKLEKLGYKDVANLYGGIFEWVNQGHQVYNSKGEQTVKVHTYNKKWSRWVNRGVKVY